MSSTGQTFTGQASRGIRGKYIRVFSIVEAEGTVVLIYTMSSSDYMTHINTGVGAIPPLTHDMGYLEKEKAANEDLQVENSAVAVPTSAFADFNQKKAFRVFWISILVVSL